MRIIKGKNESRFNLINKKRMLFYSTLSFYFVVTLPSTLLLLQSEFYRFVTIEQISSKVAHFKNPDYIFVGDSIMGGGRNWWLRLRRFPFSSITISNNGNTTRQIAGLLNQAIQLKPRYIFIMAGTNDLFDSRLSDKEIQEDWEKLFSNAKTAKIENNITVVITSVPILANTRYDERIIKINNFIKQMAEKDGYKFIDINAKLLVEIDRSQYFTDGVHFSELTYQLWAEKINQIIDE